MNDCCPGCLSVSEKLNAKIVRQPTVFAKMPLPWRYDQQSRNVLSADGAIVCRVGDSVYGDPEIGETIVKTFNEYPKWFPQLFP
jgi:hypothetical protein